jgi:hypothetical protein
VKIRTFALSATAVVVGVALWTSAAHAESCTNDSDCKAHGTTCGTDVCSWPKRVCVSSASGSPGWCDARDPSSCKCAGLGATCVGVYCVNDAGAAFVTPPDSGTSRGPGKSSKWGCTAGPGSCPARSWGFGAFALAGALAAARRRKT